MTMTVMILNQVLASISSFTTVSFSCSFTSYCGCFITGKAKSNTQQLFTTYSPYHVDMMNVRQDKNLLVFIA